MQGQLLIIITRQWLQVEERWHHSAVINHSLKTVSTLASVEVLETQVQEVIMKVAIHNTTVKSKTEDQLPEMVIQV